MSMKNIGQLVAVSTLAAASTLVSAAVNPQQGTWTTTLQGRDLNGDRIADAFYDTVLNVTWLADANWAGTSGYADQFENPSPYPDEPVGRMGMLEQKTWAAELNMYGVTGWRLHKRLGYYCVDGTCYPSNTEIAHLYFETLGNGNGGPTNTGPFTNAFLGPYWSASTFNNPDGRDFVYSQGGNFGITDEAGVYTFAWAVHNGDVGVIPEPGTYALLIAGIAALGLHRKYGRNRGEPAQTST